MRPPNAGFLGEVPGGDPAPVKKKEHLEFVTGKYPKGHVLMIGDAPGDYNAAKANDVHFFPVNPGKEEASWELFHDEIADAFRAGRYTGEYEAGLIATFNGLLPEIPSWKK